MYILNTTVDKMNSSIGNQWEFDAGLTPLENQFHELKLKASRFMETF